MPFAYSTLALVDDMSRLHLVHARWDDAAQVWVATSEDVQGLVTEAPTLEMLNSKLRTLVPELLELNGQGCDDDDQFELIARQVTSLQPGHA